MPKPPKGYTYRMTYRYRDETGDDVMETTFFKEKPTKAQIAQFAKSRSIELDEYRVDPV